MRRPDGMKVAFDKSSVYIQDKEQHYWFQFSLARLRHPASPASVALRLLEHRHELRSVPREGIGAQGVASACPSSF